MVRWAELEAQYPHGEEKNQLVQHGLWYPRETCHNKHMPTHNNGNEGLKRLYENYDNH